MVESDLDVAGKPKSVQKWYQWYSPDDTKEEKKLLLKLDLLILPYAFALFWVQFVDEGNINNAYVSGMATDLGFHGNQLVHFTTIFTVGSVVGLLPFMYIFPRVPMHYLVPTLDLLWGIFTLLQYRATSYAEIMAYRFLVALFAASYFSGVHFVLGSWYRSHEIGRRGGIFYIGLPLGYLTASLLQTAALEYLDGVNGLAGWRWLFIINAVITLPLAVAGYFIWPGTIERPNRLLIKQEELEIAKERLRKDGAKVESTSSALTTLSRALRRRRFWLIVIWDSFFFVAEASISSFLLWLDSLDRYSSAEVNRLNALGPGLGIFFIIFINFSSDLWLGRTGAITLTLTVSFTGLIMLAIWDVPEGAKWFAYSVQYSASAVSSVLYGWINVIYRDNTEERAAVIVLVTTVATVWTTWIPLFTYPTSEGPRFVHGYAFSAAITVLLVLMTFVIRYLYGENGEKRPLPPADDSTEPAKTQESTEILSEVNDEDRKDAHMSIAVQV